MIRLIERSTTISVEGSGHEIARLQEPFKFRHPSAYFSPSYQLYLASGGTDGWDGEERLLKVVQRDQGVVTAEILRGWKDSLLEYIDELDLVANTERLLESPFEHIEVDDVPDDLLRAAFVLDYNQRLCISEWLKHGMGVHKISVGGGKTALFAGAAAMIKQECPAARILYMTQSERLVRQVTGELRKFLPGLDVGMFGGGKHEYEAKDIVVATQKIMYDRRNKLDDSGWFSSFMALLMDEVHHVASQSAMDVIMRCTGAYFRFGASDTARFSHEKQIELSRIIGLAGPYRHTVAATGLIKIGRLARPNIYIVDDRSWARKLEHVPRIAQPGSQAWCFLEDNPDPVEGVYQGPVYQTDEKGEIVYKKKLTIEKEKRKYVLVPQVEQGLHEIEINGQRWEIPSSSCLLNRSYDRCIVSYEPRNKLAALWARYYSEKGWPTIVVATRTIHLYMLETYILDLVEPGLVKVMPGAASSKVRDETFEWLRATPGSILITSLVKEGVSINEIKAGVICDYVADHELMNQIIGRLVRPKAGDNESHITIFYDRQNSQFERGCMKMLTRLETISGYYYYYPVTTPDTIEKAKFFDTEAIIEEEKTRRLRRPRRLDELRQEAG